MIVLLSAEIRLRIDAALHEVLWQVGKFDLEVTGHVSIFSDQN